MRPDVVIGNVMRTLNSATVVESGGVIAVVTVGMPLELLVGDRPGKAAPWVKADARPSGTRFVKPVSGKLGLFEDLPGYATVLSFFDENPDSLPKAVKPRAPDKGIKPALVRVIGQMVSESFFPGDESDMSNVLQLALVVAAFPHMRNALRQSFLADLHTRAFTGFEKQELPPVMLDASLFASEAMVWQLQAAKLVKYRD